MQLCKCRPEPRCYLAALAACQQGISQYMTSCGTNLDSPARVEMHCIRRLNILDHTGQMHGQVSGSTKRTQELGFARHTDVCLLQQLASGQTPSMDEHTLHYPPEVMSTCNIMQEIGPRKHTAKALGENHGKKQVPHLARLFWMKSSIPRE